MVSTTLTPKPPFVPITRKPFPLADFSDVSTSTLLSGTSSRTVFCSSPVPTHEVLHLQARRRHSPISGNTLHNVEVHVIDHPPPDRSPLASSLSSSPTSSSSSSPSVKVHAVSASMAWKGEDRHACVKVDEQSSSQLLAFAGVFDGHDGPDAADYCAKGLLPHILLETDDVEDLDPDSSSSSNSSSWRLLSRRFSERSRTSSQSFFEDIYFDPDEEQLPLARAERNKKLSSWRDRLQPGYTRAFAKAQGQFAETGTAPSFCDVALQRQSKMERRMIGGPSKQACPEDSYCRKLIEFLRRHHSGKNKSDCNSVRHGGTTACTLSIYLGTNDRGSSEPFAIVANCGDSRLLTDDGGKHNNSTFRRVTNDHRIVNDAEDDEVVRLLAAKAILKNQRVYPGGLAVSRTIGDVAYSSAVITTPDVFAIDLMPFTTDGGSLERTDRFVIATDGLWDSLDLVVKNSAYRSVERLVGELAARRNEMDPKKAAVNLMERCLLDVGCFDDISIVVMDVTVQL